VTVERQATEALRHILAQRISARTCLPIAEVSMMIAKIPDAVVSFVGSDGADLALSIWVVLQLVDDDCESYWMMGYPKQGAAFQ
jgi:hypothetical protein